jgi:hypothetical protein
VAGNKRVIFSLSTVGRIWSLGPSGHVRLLVAYSVAFFEERRLLAAQAAPSTNQNSSPDALASSHLIKRFDPGALLRVGELFVVLIGC